MAFRYVSPELQEKARSCKMPEAIASLAKEAGSSSPSSSWTRVPAAGSGDCDDEPCPMAWHA